MRCKNCEYDLPDYVQGRLTPERSSEIELHIRNCPLCESETAKLKLLFAELDSEAASFDDNPGGDFPAKVMQRIENRQAAWKPGFAAVKVGIPAVAAGFLVAFLFLMPGPQLGDHAYFASSARDMKYIIGSMDSLQISLLQQDYAPAPISIQNFTADLTLPDIEGDSTFDEAFPLFAGIPDEALLAASAEYLPNQAVLELLSDEDIKPLIESGSDEGRL